MMNNFVLAAYLFVFISLSVYGLKSFVDYRKSRNKFELDKNSAQKGKI